MKQYKNNELITISGVTFHGVEDILAHARSGEPKQGLFVADDSKGYPCFDSYDYATENRRFHNFIFAFQKDELEERLQKLKRMSQLRYNYNKLTPELHPMAYWEGDVHHNVLVTEATE